MRLLTIALTCRSCFGSSSSRRKEEKTEPRNDREVNSATFARQLSAECCRTNLLSCCSPGPSLKFEINGKRNERVRGREDERQATTPTVRFHGNVNERLLNEFDCSRSFDDLA